MKKKHGWTLRHKATGILQIRFVNQSPRQIQEDWIKTNKHLNYSDYELVMLTPIVVQRGLMTLRLRNFELSSYQRKFFSKWLFDQVFDDGSN